MNIFKWFICWFNKTHVLAKFFDKDGKVSISALGAVLRSKVLSNEIN